MITRYKDENGKFIKLINTDFYIVKDIRQYPGQCIIVVRKKHI